MNNTKQVLLSVKHINKYFKKGGYLFKAVNDACFDIYKGDFFGVIGESGSGKSTIGKIIIRLLTAESGVITFDDNLISQLKISRRMTSWLAKNMQMVFQDPMGSLNPKKNIINIISEPLRISKSIHKEADEIIKNHLKINPYFQYTYKQKDYELSKEFDDYYFQSMIGIFTNGIQEVKSYKYDKDLTLDENKFEFLSILLKLDEQAKKVNYSLYKYSNNIRKIFNHCKEIHDNKQNHPIEIKLFEAKNELSYTRKLLFHSKEYYEYKAKIKRLKNELKEHLASSSEKYIDQNKKYIEGVLDATQIEILNLKQRLSICNTYIGTLNLLLHIKVKKLYLNIIQILPNLDMINLQDLENLLTKIRNFLNNKISIIEKQISDLKILSDNKDQIIEKIYKNNDEIIQKNILDFFNSVDIDKDTETKLNELLSSMDKIVINNLTSSVNQVYTFNDIFRNIKSLVSTINNKIKNLTFDLNEIQDILNLKEYPSYTKRCIDKNYTNQIKNIIFYCKKYISIIKSEKKKNSEEYYDNFVRYQELLQEVKNISNECEKYYEEQIDVFNATILPKIKQHKVTLKKYESNLSSLRSKFKQIVKKKLQDIFRQVKKYNQYDKDGVISFKSDALIRLRTIDSLSFEFETILEEVTLYRNLRHINPLFVKMQKPALIKVLTRFKVYKALNSVGLKNEHAYRYPHEFSGGQRQRIVIARALINNPKLIIADEPISALDVSIQAQVINIMKELADKNGITFMFIAHDLSMVNYACNRMIIMHNGRILEKGDTNEIFENPTHPYTLSLLKASPQLSKIHVNLAETNNSNYGYNPNSIDEANSKFYSVSHNKEHYVYGTQEQIKLWTKTKNHLG